MLWYETVVFLLLQAWQLQTTLNKQIEAVMLKTVTFDLLCSLLSACHLLNEELESASETSGPNCQHLKGNTAHTASKHTHRVEASTISEAVSAIRESVAYPNPTTKSRNTMQGVTLQPLPASGLHQAVGSESQPSLAAGILAICIDRDEKRRITSCVLSQAL